MKQYKLNDGECNCGVTAALNILGAKWKIILIVALSKGANRFNDIKKVVPKINDRALSLKLKELEADGLIERTVQDGNPPKVEYTLTQKGKDVKPIIKCVHKWADTHLCCNE